MSEDLRYQDLATYDPEVHAAIVDELARQRDTLEMIASENFVPRSVLQAQGSVLTNKYAEGYPGRRYYGGCEHVDVIEDLARNRAKEVFGAQYDVYKRQPSTRTCSRTRVRRPTPRCSWRWRSRATPSWAWTWRTAATSPTA